MKHRRPIGSWIPLFLTKILGFLDAKRGAVRIGERNASGQYLAYLSANCGTCIHLLYADLEKNTAKIRKESAQLSLEYANLMALLSAPYETPSGATVSIRIRSEKRIAAAKQELQSQKREIEGRLAVIEEELSKASNEANTSSMEAVSLTKRRVHAYLYGACIAMRASYGEIEYEVKNDCSDAEKYDLHHEKNSAIRRCILSSALKGVDGNEIKD